MTGSRLTNLMTGLALAILLFLAVQPILTSDFTCGYDNSFHLWRAVQVGHCLRQGYIYPRFAPDMAHGYGFLLFNFVSPGSAHVAAVLNLMGLSWPVAVNGTFILGMALGGVFIFVLVRDLFGSAAGLVAAAAYLFAPFQAYDVFNRGGLSESFAWAFPPLVLWAVHRWSLHGRRWFLLLAALSLAGFILTHNLFAFLFSPLLAGWVLLEAYLSRDWRVVGRGALAGLLGLGLCAFFWLPGLAERDWVQTGRLLGTWVFDYRYNFLDLRQLFALPRVVDPALINDWPPKALGLLPALAALLPLARYRWLDRSTRYRFVLLLVITAGLAFLTLSASRPLWDHLPLLPYVQFPWRFLGPAAFCAALLAGIAVSNPQSPIPNLQFPISNLRPAIIILLLVLSNLGWFYPDHCSPPLDTSIAGMIAWERATDTLGATAKGEYLPIWVHQMPHDPALDAAYAAGESIARLSPESLPQGARILRAEYGPVDATIELETPTPFRARYLAFYYPGWRVTVDGTSVSVAPTEPGGLVSFDVPVGRHTIRVRFGETPLRLAADAISLFSLAVLIVAAVLCKSQSSNYSIARSFTTPLSLLALVLLLLLKLLVIDRFDTPLRHPNLVDGRLRDVDVPAEITFGDEFTLLGYDRLPESVSSGDRFEIKTYWRALEPGGLDYGVTVNVVDSDGYRWNGADIRPPRWHRTPPPVGEWPPDQYAIVALSVPLLPGTPPGDYTIEIVAFDQDTLFPLTAHDADGRALGPALVLGRITVTAPRPVSLDELGVCNWLDVPLGPLTLLGADFDRDEAAPGDPVLLTSFWRSEEQPAEDLSFNLTLQAVDGSSVADYDLPPTVAWYPTSSWEAGDVWRGQRLVHLPAALDTGDYTWILSLPSGPSVSLSVISVVAPDRIFTPPTPQHPVGVTLGDVATLLGFSLEPETVRPGDTLTVTLFWRAEAESHISYNAFLHLADQSGTLVAQSDGIPAGWTRPTTGWLPGEFIIDAHALVIPSGAPLGDYTLSAGLYVPGGERLNAPDGSDAIPLIILAEEEQRPIVEVPCGESC